ncbi:hypothetical protein HSB1_31640 [Halogranum salarium B-1]|uniref:Uncharacterized protein n=1 Tax=Halogranum salarium B-1 TaxID=1210908 RepID=J3JEV1_9EURY|nr:hypothetical protein HSB1_31640 [Halogranum salarium B-1]
MIDSMDGFDVTTQQDSTRATTQSRTGVRSTARRVRPSAAPFGLR